MSHSGPSLRTLAPQPGASCRGRLDRRNYSYDTNPGPTARSAQVNFSRGYPSGSVFTLGQAAPSGGSCLYEQDFTSNPLWPSLAPAYAFWDSAQGNYYDVHAFQ